MTLRINDRFKNREITYFNDVVIDLKYDAIASTFQVSYYFDPLNPEHKELSCVGHYHVCQLLDGDELILTGFILSIKFDSEAKDSLCHISGYSLPGVLEDCQIPPMDRNRVRISLQSDNLCLREIAEKYVEPFGIGIVISPIVKDEMEIKYPQVEAKETETVKNFLANLCSQVDITLTHDRYGNLVFTREAPSKPVFHFDPDELPGVKMSLNFNGQAMHSVIYVLGQADFEDSNKAESEPLINPFIPNQNNVFRPRVATQSKKSENAVDVDESAKNLRANEIRALGFTIDIDRAKLNGKILRPGQVISAINPKVYLYKKTNFFVEVFKITKDANNLERAVITCCPPEAFTGAEPVYPFRGVNLHA